MASLAIPETNFYAITLMTLNLDHRAEIVELYTKDMKERGLKEPDHEKIACQWYGEQSVSQLPAEKKEEALKVMEWIYDHRYRIIDHQLMRDQDLATNIYKWRYIDGKRIALYDDYEDWTYYTDEEKKLLFRECQHESEVKYRHKHGHKGKH